MLCLWQMVPDHQRFCALLFMGQTELLKILFFVHMFLLVDIFKNCCYKITFNPIYATTQLIHYAWKTYMYSYINTSLLYGKIIQ